MGSLLGGPEGWFRVDEKFVEVYEFVDELAKCKGEKLGEAKKIDMLAIEFKVGSRTFSFSQTD